MNHFFTTLNNSYLLFIYVSCVFQLPANKFLMKFSGKLEKITIFFVYSVKKKLFLYMMMLSSKTFFK